MKNLVFLTILTMFFSACASLPADPSKPENRSDIINGNGTGNNNHVPAPQTTSLWERFKAQGPIAIAVEGVVGIASAVGFGLVVKAIVDKVSGGGGIRHSGNIVQDLLPTRSAAELKDRLAQPFSDAELTALENQWKNLVGGDADAKLQELKGMLSGEYYSGNLSSYFSNNSTLDTETDGFNDANGVSQARNKQVAYLCSVGVQYQQGDDDAKQAILAYLHGDTDTVEGYTNKKLGLLTMPLVWHYEAEAQKAKQTAKNQKTKDDMTLWLQPFFGEVGKGADHANADLLLAAMKLIVDNDEKYKNSYAGLVLTEKLEEEFFDKTVGYNNVSFEQYWQLFPWFFEKEAEKKYAENGDTYIEKRGSLKEVTQTLLSWGSTYSQLPPNERKAALEKLIQELNNKAGDWTPYCVDDTDNSVKAVPLQQGNWNWSKDKVFKLLIYKAYSNLLYDASK